MKRKEITDQLSREFRKLALDIEVWLYGSEARGDARPHKPLYNNQNAMGVAHDTFSIECNQRRSKTITLDHQ